MEDERNAGGKKSQKTLMEGINGTRVKLRYACADREELTYLSKEEKENLRQNQTKNVWKLSLS